MGMCGTIGTMMARFPGLWIGAITGLLLGIIAGFVPFARSLKMNDRYIRKGLATARKRGGNKQHYDVAEDIFHEGLMAEDDNVGYEHAKGESDRTADAPYSQAASPRPPPTASDRSGAASPRPVDVHRPTVRTAAITPSRLSSILHDLDASAKTSQSPPSAE
eukprot:GHVQ01029086.1.p2 GENE.GHVQ01029086.1~~GHVQ01029086.1.p2  ORF type:complete len:162 (+),score=15.06 GHVQ01029086.1:2-487(+)